MSCRAGRERAGRVLGVPIALCRRFPLLVGGAAARGSQARSRLVTSPGPLSISRSNGEPRTTSFSLNQTETPSDSSRSCSSFAGPLRSSHAWQRKTSRRSGRSARFSTLSRTGVSARTSAGVYATAEPTRDHLGLPLLPDPPTLLRTPPRLLSNGGVGRIGVRPIAAVAPVAATACRAPLAVRWPRTGAVHLANSHSSPLQI